MNRQRPALLEHPQTMPMEETKLSPRKNNNTNNVDQEMDRIYGTARGLADLTLLSDWEKDS